jgi:hypothetical protein
MEHVKKNENVWSGSFKPVKPIQEHILKVDDLFDWEHGYVKEVFRNQSTTVDLEETLLPTEDEETINIVLVLLLQNILDLINKTKLNISSQQSLR